MKAIELVLQEQVQDDRSTRDAVRLEFPVDITGEFCVGELDYLKDSDGELNLRYVGTNGSVHSADTAIR